MNEYLLAVVVGLVVTSISAFAIWILCLKYKKNKAVWAQIAEDSYIRGKDEASEIIKSTCDQIEDDKNRLSGLSDRELLVETMLALGTYGRRIDRIDEKLKCITNYKAYIDDMNKQTYALSQSFVVLEGNISTTAGVINGLRQTIQETSTHIHKLIVDLSSLTNLHIKIDNHVQTLYGVEENLSYIHGKIAAVVEDMEAVMGTYDQSPMTKLKGIEREIVNLAEVVASIRNDVGSISGATDKIKTAIDDSMEEYTYGSLFYRIADIADKLSSLESEVGSVSSKVYDIKSTVENSLSSYGYDSLYSKLDDISSSVSSIRYKVDA